MATNPIRRRVVAALALPAAAMAGGVLGADAALIFTVHPFDTPSRLYERFRPLCDYLETVTDRPIRLRVAATYDEQIAAIADGRADLTYIGPTPYVLARARGAVRLLAAEATGEGPYYRSVIVVRSDSPIRQLADLRGRSMALGADRSFSSSYIPRLMLQEAGVELGDLARHEFLGRHERVALAVLHGDFDAGGLRLDIARQYLRRGLRVIAQSDPLPAHAIAASPALSPQTAERVRAALLAPSPAGAAAIRALGPQVTFVETADGDFDLARRVLQRLR